MQAYATVTGSTRNREAITSHSVNIHKLDAARRQNVFLGMRT